MLEFASGYGRFTRHLARFPGADKVTVSDVMPGAVEFAVEKFGVSGFSSSAEPADVYFPRQYECIFVLSLFSHLPRATWGPWLQRLYSAVEPGGSLVFTTHGDGFAKRNGVGLDSEGFFFVATSESDHLKDRSMVRRLLHRNL
ncbi:MAG: class I SAM-dependent methyltransferase [Haliea sp.]|nr:class I SAM-dependent methyltransferase [Haliea sp.]